MEHAVSELLAQRVVEGSTRLWSSAMGRNLEREKETEKRKPKDRKKNKERKRDKQTEIKGRDKRTN